MNTSRKCRILGAAAIIAGGAFSAGPGLAADVPLSHVADPAVYKVIGENDLFRVVMATWKPGQRDVYHSHPANVAYRLNDCNMRSYGPDGKVLAEGERKAGTLALQAPVPSHSLENIGTAACQVLIVERK